MSNIIRRYIDHMKFVAFMAFSFTTFLHVLLVLFLNHCVYVYVLGCILLFNSVSYVFLLLCLCILLLCILCSVYPVFFVLTGILWLP
jgi:hypothetical protein